MSIKDDLKKVAKAIAWPFVHLVEFLFSPKGVAALKLAYREMAKTPLGQVIVPIVEKYAARTDLTSEQKFEGAFAEIVAQAGAIALEWKESLVDLGIELAVQAVKNAWGVTPTPGIGPTPAVKNAKK